MSGPRPLDAAWRLVFRLGFPLARVWWRLRGARPEGALVAVYVDRALLLVRSSYQVECKSIDEARPQLLRVGPVEVGRGDERETAIGRSIEGGPVTVARPAGLTRPHTTESGGLSGRDPLGGGAGKCETGAEDIAALH